MYMFNNNSKENTMKTLDYLEDLEAQLNSFNLKAIQNGDTDIAVLIYKFRQKIVQIENNIKAEQETA